MLSRRKLLAGSALAGIATPSLARAILPLAGSGQSVSPTSDALAQLLAQMAPGQWKQLTSPNTGNAPGDYLTNMLPSKLGYWDPGVAYSGNQASPNGAGSPIAFANDAACWQVYYQGAPNIDELFAFSSCAIRRKDGLIGMSGGGHVATADNGIYGFSCIAAAASLLTGGSGGKWFTIKRSGKMIRTCDPRPSWSRQTKQNLETVGDISGPGATSITNIPTFLNTWSSGGVAQCSADAPAGTNTISFASLAGTKPSTGGPITMVGNSIGCANPIRKAALPYNAGGGPLVISASTNDPTGPITLTLNVNIGAPGILAGDMITFSGATAPGNAIGDGQIALPPFQTIVGIRGTVGSYIVDFGSGSALAAKSQGFIGCATAQMWATDNVDGQHCLIQGHTYYGNMFDDFASQRFFFCGGGGYPGGDSSYSGGYIAVSPDSTPSGDTVLVTTDLAGLDQD